MLTNYIDAPRRKTANQRLTFEYRFKSVSYHLRELVEFSLPFQA